MKLYSFAALAVIVAASPAGCPRAQQDLATAQRIVGSDLSTACALVASADAAFQALAASGALPGANRKAVARAYAGVAAVCANPAAVADPIAALQTIANAYAAVMKARPSP